MAISAEVTKKPHSSVQLDINIDAEDVKQAFDTVYRQLLKKVRVKGFRPGKAPVGIIRMKYGESVAQDVLQDLLNKAFRSVIQEKQLHPVGGGSIIGELPKLDEEKAYAFSMAVDVYPEVDLPEYKGLSVTRHPYKITDKDVDAEVEKFRERFARLEDKQGAAGPEDIVVLNYTVEQDGETLEKYSREHYSFDVNSGLSYPPLAKELVGKQAGDSFEVNKDFPADFPEKIRAGKPALFKVNVEEVQTRVLPEVTDEFVARVSPHKTVDEFRSSLREYMEHNAREQESRQVQNDLLDQILKKTRMEVPLSMVESELDTVINNLKHTLLYSRIDFQDYLKQVGKSEASVRDEFRAAAEKQVQRLLILNEIGKAEEIEATDSEVNDEINKLATQYRQSFEDTKQYFTEKGELDSIAYGIRKHKTLDFLENNAKIKDGKAKPFAELND